MADPKEVPGGSTDDEENPPPPDLDAEAEKDDD